MVKGSRHHDQLFGQCLPKHRHGEFLIFLRTIDKSVPKGLQVHLILDNHQTRRGRLPRRPDLIVSVEDYLRVTNEQPTPLVWTATAESILERARRGRVALQAVANQS